jgi:hypothetical protein
MIILTRAALVLAAAVFSAALIGCSAIALWEPGAAETSSPVPGGERYPDVLAVELRPLDGREFDVAVTLASPYDTPERYADGWRVLDPEGNELGSHTLLHDHASEQPFTRTQRGLHIPEDVDLITVEGRDQTNGFGGLTVTVEVPES